MNEMELVLNKEIREQCIERIEILEKVKGLLLIPNSDFATVNLIADYYEVGEECIKSVVFENQEELLSDGLIKLNYNDTKEFLVSCLLQPTNFRGYFEAGGMRFANRSNTLIPRRAILNKK